MTARRPAPGQPEIGYIEPGHVPAGYLTERPPSPWGSRLVHWAATAAVLAAIICLVGWPWPTLYALGLLAGASILLAGIRLLAAERRKPTGPSRRHALAFNALSRTLSDAGEHVRLSVRDRATTAVLNAIDGERPDASGPAPETTRTIPEASGQQVADQAGDHPEASGQHTGPAHAMLAALAQSIAALPAPAPRHPDAALRGRVAAALLARIKQATISGPQPFGTDPLTRFLAANEYDLADVVLAELAPELDALAALHHGEEPYTDEACVPTPAQWIWRWNHATPAQRLEIADRVLTNAERLTATHAVVLRLGDPHDDLALHVRAALLGNPPPVAHRTAEQPVSRPQPVDESADDRGEVVQ